MTTTTVQKMIDAPIERVFDTIAHIENFSKAVPHIVGVEMLSDTTSGVGTRFRETRLMRGREMKTVLEVTEYAENKEIRIVSDEHGTVWDTRFTVEPRDGKTLLTVVMDAKPHKLPSKLINPFLKGFLKTAIEQDMDAVKKYCEQ